jgi:hypothetical protein
MPLTTSKMYEISLPAPGVFTTVRTAFRVWMKMSKIEAMMDSSHHLMHPER